MKRRFCCSESRRSEVAVELVVEGEAEMQSRNTKGFITLIAVAALFFSVAVPQSFAQPEGDHNADKEIQHWQRVWVAEKDDKKGAWEEEYLDKFSEEDLKPEDDTTPNKKVTKWLEQLSDEDETKQIEFLEKVYVKDAGDKKKETIQPYKLVQALKSVLVEKHDQVSRDESITDKEEAMTNFVDGLFKRMSYKDGSSKFRKAIGTKGEAYDMLMDRVKAVLGEKSKEELEEMTEEELLEEIFTDEIKKALGLDANEESEEEEEEEEEQGDEDKDKDGISKEDLAKLLDERDKAQAKKFEDMLKNLTIPTNPPVNSGIGEKITKDLEDLKNRACAAQEKDNGIADLIDRFNEGLADLSDAADLGDVDDNNDGLFDSLLASALGQGNRDQNRQLDQGEAVVPPQQQIPPFASQPSQADSGSDLPQTPQPLGPQPIPPRQLPQLVDTSVKEVETVGLQPIAGDSQQGLIDGAKAVLANSQDEAELGNLFGSYGNILAQVSNNPIVMLSNAVAKKNDAITKFTQMKGLRDSLQRAASTIRGEIEEIEASEQQAFAKTNPAAALSLEEAKQQVSNFEAQMKQVQQQASSTNPDGSPQYADSDIQNRISELQRLKADQEKQVRLGEQLKGSFMASRNTKYKSLKRELQDAESLASQADTEAKRYAGEAKTAATEEQTILLSQQQNTSSMIPTVNGFASVNGVSQPFTRPNGQPLLGSGFSGRGFNNSLAGPSNGNAARGLLRGGAQ